MQTLSATCRVMTDFSHLDALQARLRSECARLKAATKSNEIEIRTVWVAQIEREIADEYRFLGIDPTVDADIAAMSNEELLEALA